MRPPFRWHTSLSAGPQLYQHMMRAMGIPALLSLRDLRHVKFLLPRRSGPDSLQNHEMTEIGGSDPGGFLETVVRRRTMQPFRTDEYGLVDIRLQQRHANQFYRLSEDCEGDFPFSDCPAELRNTMTLTMAWKSRPNYSAPICCKSAVRWRGKPLRSTSARTPSNSADPRV